jgi:hypothetical protein
MKSAASTTGDNVDEFKIWRASWEACSSNLEFGNHLNICLKTEENQENLCREDLNPDLVYIICKNLVRTSKKTPYFTIRKIYWLTLFKEIITVYSENCTEHKHTKYIVIGC